MLHKCSFQIRDGVRVPLAEEDKDRIEAENDNMAGGGPASARDGVCQRIR